MAIIRFS